MKTTKRYSKKPIHGYQAFLYEGSKDIETAKLFCGQRCPAYQGIENKLFIDTQRGWLLVEKGDYILKRNEEITVCSGKLFHQIYEEERN